MRTRIVLLAAVALLGAWLLWQSASLAPVAAPSAAKGTEAAAPASEGSTATAPAPSLARDHAGGGEQVGDDQFVSESEDDGVIANPVRDGVTILVLGADRRPRSGARLRVGWRKGFGMYGNDHGIADAGGRFATTVAEHEMIEDVTLTDPVHGELRNGSAMLPMMDEPRTVQCIVPQLHPLTVRVADERGAAIAAATVEAQCVRIDEVPREFVLLPSVTDVGVDAAGRASLHVPAAAYELTAKADGYATMYTLRTEVPPGGRTVTVHLQSVARRHDVVVTVVVAPGLTGPIVVEGYTKELPALPGLEPEGVEPVHMQFAGRATGPGTFVVAAPPLPWRCSARIGGVWGSTEVDAFATAVTVELSAPKLQPMAKLRCKLLLPDGEPTYGTVMVHTTPDLVRGPSYDVRPSSPFVTVEPGGLACVSAKHYQYPPVVVGPIELKDGEQEVELQLVKPQSIRGRVVDEQGKPVKAMVNLLRPAGALAALRAGLPAILAHSADGDSRGTLEDGAFWFEDLGTGEHALYAAPEQVGWPGYLRVQPGDQNIVLRLGDGIDDRVRIEGRVTLSTTGTPVMGARVTWRSADWSQERYTDAEGRYTATMPPGAMHYTVMARHCAWLESEPASLAKGLQTRDLVLTPSEPLFIKVRDEAGRVPQLDVMAFDAKGREIPFLDHNGNCDGSVLQLDANGRAELGGLPHEPLRLRLQTAEEDQSLDVDVPGTFRRDADFPIVWKPRAKAK